MEDTGGEWQGLVRQGKDVYVKKMKLSELVLDFELYPRNNIDQQNVRTLLQAIMANAELPPIVIDKKSKRVIDGFHRIKAYLRHYGEDHEVNVIEKSYANEADMFLDAMRYNGNHGARLDPCDRARCAIIAERLSIPLDAVAGALHMTTEKLGELRSDRTAKDAGGITIPIKRTIHKFAGRKLNKRQMVANDKLSGMSQQFYANQLIELIESGMLDLEDENLVGRLKILHQLLEETLVAA